MSIFEARKDPLVMSLSTKFTYLLVISVLLWSLGAPTFLSFAHAANLTTVSDTLSDSNLSVVAAHTFRFTTQTLLNDTGGADTLTITMEPNGGNNFTIGSLGASGITASGVTVVANSGACSAGNDMILSTTTTSITLTMCTGDTVPALTNIVLSTATSTITNPAAEGSYQESIVTTDGATASTLDSADLRVAILNNVVVTASVDTSFTFTVNGLATSTALVGDPGITTTGSSTPTALAFNTLTPGASSTLGQQLTVATNARNGFVVTVQEDQPLTSSTGATISLFANGATTSVPTAWVAPSNTLDQPWTYGHMGLTSDDQDEGGGEFVGGKYVGNFDTPRPVFSHTGPADGTTQNKGKADVFYTIQIGTLQPAGNDYTNTLTYVATPTF